MPKFIKWAKAKKASQPIYEYAPQSHQSKAGTPTMGGVVFIFSTIIATLLTAKLNNFYIIGGLLTLALYSLIGMQDDYSKISKDIDIVIYTTIYKNPIAYQRAYMP
jgi:phospho-N-acetylmuramoyl-pentapeptide-transferase